MRGHTLRLLKRRMEERKRITGDRRYMAILAGKSQSKTLAKREKLLAGLR